MGTEPASPARAQLDAILDTLDDAAIRSLLALIQVWLTTAPGATAPPADETP